MKNQEPYKNIPFTQKRHGDKYFPEMIVMFIISMIAVVVGSQIDRIF